MADLHRVIAAREAMEIAAAAIRVADPRRDRAEASAAAAPADIRAIETARRRAEATATAAAAIRAADLHRDRAVDPVPSVRVRAAAMTIRRAETLPPRMSAAGILRL